MTKKIATERGLPLKHKFRFLPLENESLVEPRFPVPPLNTFQYNKNAKPEDKDSFDSMQKRIEDWERWLEKCRFISYPRCYTQPNLTIIGVLL